MFNGPVYVFEIHAKVLHLLSAFFTQSDVWHLAILVKIVPNETERKWKSFYACIGTYCVRIANNNFFILVITPQRVVLRFYANAVSVIFLFFIMFLFLCLCWFFFSNQFYQLILLMYIYFNIQVHSESFYIILWMITVKNRRKMNDEEFVYFLMMII